MEYIMPLVQAMAELDEKSLMDAMQDALREKQKTERIENSLQEGLKQVGVRFGAVLSGGHDRERRPLSGGDESAHQQQTA